MKNRPNRPKYTLSDGWTRVNIWRVCTPRVVRLNSISASPHNRRNQPPTPTFHRSSDTAEPPRHHSSSRPLCLHAREIVVLTRSPSDSESQETLDRRAANHRSLVLTIVAVARHLVPRTQTRTTRNQ
ncbi:hypothetical protein HID58_027399 [Brassica napus]|uniref:Uncharacterized protein n=1 Tax=Brassica napus TaxID=3708 RepID=A0ABQ8CRP9_BRANA|nr:hypothetical protein HID58_027399 [Brassica napus]